MPLYNISAAQYSGYLDFFNRNSRNGFMGKPELRAIMAKFNVKPSGEDLQNMIDMISVTSDGITYQAFIDYIASYQALRDTTNEYTEAFRIYDRSGTGKLTRDDISAVMKLLGTTTNLDSLFKEVDQDRDGVISYKEFVKLMQLKL